MKAFLILIILLAAFSFGADQARYNADNGNTGQFSDTILKPPLKLKWRYFTSGGFKASPIVFNGRLFCSDRWGQVYALEGETGRLIWKKYYYTGYGDNAVPLAYGNYLYFFGSAYAALYCVRQDNGQQQWKFDDIGVNTIYRGKYSPVAYNGKVYAATRTVSTTFRVVCLNAAAGTLLWSKEYPGVDAIGTGEVVICTLTTPPSVIGFYNAGSLNWCPGSGMTFALSADSGKVLWENSSWFCKRLTVYDTLAYISSCSAGAYTDGALNVRTGLMVKQGKLESIDDANAPLWTINGRYIFAKPYCLEPEFYNQRTWARIGGCDWSAITANPRFETGCGAIALANGYGYFGLGGGGGNTPVAGGRGRGGLGQGLYAFEIPRDSTVNKLKIVWQFKTASNFCSTPVIADGKLYATSNQEGAIYCFENQ
jgi:outer membrane protein assembly factor BamB